jgi:hypothetical protein
MTLRLNIPDDGRGYRRRSTRGDGSPLASFLCPVCRHDVLVEDVACDHLLLVRDRYGEVYCRDRRVRELHRRAENEIGGRGENAVERLCELLGPTVVLYELVDAPHEAPRGASTLFVVDVGEDLRRAGGAEATT